MTAADRPTGPRVVGQGVTAEQAWDEGYEAGWRKRLNRNPYRDVVRSGEQGGE